MSSTYGENLNLSIFGTSHGSQIGMTLQGIPAGLPIDLNKLQEFLNRRAPGQNDWSTPRKEADRPVFQSGFTDGRTNGECISAVIYNQNVRSGDYRNLQCIPRPGHADYTAWVKYGKEFDMAGGGPFSGRLTAPMCIAGGLCKQWLEEMGIRIGAHIAWIGDIDDNRFDPIDPNLDGVGKDFPVLSDICGQQMREAIAEAKKKGDSIGGIVECAITGLPAGLGGPLFDGVEGKIAQIVYGIPAVKGVDFGLGFATIYHPGSYNNDAFTVVNGKIRTETNHSGGILGGITNGMPILFRAAFKPTPSVAKPQQSVDLQTGKITTIQINGRHDPCIVPRAVPVVEAAAAIAVYDLILGNTQAHNKDF